MTVTLLLASDGALACIANDTVPAPPAFPDAKSQTLPEPWREIASDPLLPPPLRTNPPVPCRDSSDGQPLADPISRLADGTVPFLEGDASQAAGCVALCCASGPAASFDACHARPRQMPCDKDHEVHDQMKGYAQCTANYK